MQNTIRTITIDAWTDTTVAAGATSDAYTLDLEPYQITGTMTLQLKISGTGTAKVYYTSSNDGVTYQTAEDATDSVTGMTVGEKVIVINPVFSRYIKLYVEETGSTNSITIVKAILAMK